MDLLDAAASSWREWEVAIGPTPSMANARRVAKRERAKCGSRAGQLLERYAPTKD